jgi:hypothetical protein
MTVPMEDVEFDVESLDVDTDEQPPTFSSSTPTKTVTTAASDISSRDDPFAPREGKALLWRGVNMTLVGQSSACCLACFCEGVQNVFFVRPLTCVSHISTTFSLFFVLLAPPFFGLCHVVHHHDALLMLLTDRRERVLTNPIANFSKMCGVRFLNVKPQPSWVPVEPARRVS